MERSKPVGICIDDGKRQVVNVITWEQRKLGDVVEDYVEKTTVEDQYPVLTSSQQNLEFIVLQDDYFSGKNRESKRKYRVFCNPSRIIFRR